MRAVLKPVDGAFRWAVILAVLLGPTLLELEPIAAEGSPSASPVQSAGMQLAPIAIDYPEEGTIFPPEFRSPTFLWRDTASEAVTWSIEIRFDGAKKGKKINSKGELMRVGEIDPRCVAPTNELPKLTPEQAVTHTWVPDALVWAEIKKRSRKRPAIISITGFSDQKATQAVSRSEVAIRTSNDPVGAPIFYRDVPLMPADTQKGVIKPLVPEAIPLIAWRLLALDEPGSRIMMEGLPTCANCHTFSRDGKTLGLDVDGPQNDKGLYGLVPVKSHTSIRQEHIITWRSVYEGDLGGRLRTGFMSQVSPDGQYVITTINDPGVPQTETRRRENPTDLVGNYFVTNFKDYRFGQVFFPTRGITAWYSRATGRLKPLPGADDRRYVQTNATWSPDGQYLVFSRAEAKDAYSPDGKVAEYANDPNETQIQYDLYRIPFNGGKGGTAEPIAGASRNGMSNSFPRISPDGRWIVFVQCRNGQLMRPDSQLYIVPVEGGKARRMRCNTSLMNSWHSFSPNGRWMVFSSKSRSPYTQMYLTHIDENGQDSPAILIENSTAANRAVNLPEFVNVPPGGLVAMDAPATEFYQLFDTGATLVEAGDHEGAIPVLRKALDLNPEDVRSHNKLGIALAGVGRTDEAIAEYQKATALDPDYFDAYVKLGLAFAGTGKMEAARQQLEKAVKVAPENPDVHSTMVALLIGEGRLDEAIAYSQTLLEHAPEHAGAHGNFAIALTRKGRFGEAIPHFEKALGAGTNSADLHSDLATALFETGRRDEALQHLQRAVTNDPSSAVLHRQLGRFLAEMRKFDEAIPHLEKALASTPDAADLHHNLARIQASRGRFKEAIPHFEKVIELVPEAGQDPVFLGMLSAAYAEAGQFPEAEQTALRALDLAKSRNDQALIAALSARIELYRTRRRAGQE